MRFEALWRTWEQARLEPVTGMATWLREHLDHHVPILLGPQGPFALCEPGRHEDMPPRPVDPLPQDPTDDS